MVAYQFPYFTVNDVMLKYVNEFLIYLGHVVSNTMVHDADIHREHRNSFYQC